MATARRPRTTSRIPSRGNEGIAEKDEDGTERGKQRKRKLSDMLGPPWTKDDLELFYLTYRKYGRDWTKVAKSMNKRTVEMVEALYGMNRAYLSLPEGAASAAGLIAMMTDHYNILEGTEEEFTDEIDLSDRNQQLQPRLRRRAGVGSYVHLGPSSYGGPSPAKKPRSAAASRPRVVGKRTPRYPVGIVAEKNGRRKVLADKSSQDDESTEDESDFTKVAEVVALTLATASQRVSSPMAAHTPTRRSCRTTLLNGNAKDSPYRTESGGLIQKHTASTSGEAESEDSEDSKDKPPNASSSVTVDKSDIVDRTGRRFADGKSRWMKPLSKKPKLQQFEETMEDTKEDSRQTELRDGDGGEKRAIAQRKKYSLPQRPTKRSRQLFSGAGYGGLCLSDHIDQNSALDALATLADLSLNGLLPSPTLDSGSTVKFFEEKVEDKLHKQESVVKDADRNGVKQMEALEIRKELNKCVEDCEPGELAEKEGTGCGGGCAHLSVSPSETRKKKRKSACEKADGYGRIGADFQAQVETQVVPPFRVDVHGAPKARSKPKRVSSLKNPVKHGSRTSKPVEASAVQVEPLTLSSAPSAATEDNCLPFKPRSKKKGAAEKSLGHGSGDVNLIDPDQEMSKEFPHCPHTTPELGPFNMKARLTHCLSPNVRRWCVYEWFYSAIDLPWFARNEFVEYLNHAGLGHVPRLTRVEWGVIRSSLGKPRRLSKRFLQEERDKLEKYRESVRTHYHELRSGLREGLPSDLARPLTVGQRVIARHPKTRQIHDGSILTVDRSRCRVQFDRPELGVELVMDIDAMPIHPLENMPEVMRRKRIILDATDRSIDDTKVEVKARASLSAGGAARAALNERLERPGFMPGMAAMTQFFLNNLMKKAQGNSLDSVRMAKIATNEAVAATQQALITQPFSAGQSQARETDIRALVELGGALNKKEALVVELRRMNDEASGFKGSEPFKRQYATVILQLKEVNEQVLDALKHLRHRNKYQDNAVPPWHRASPQGTLVFGNSCFGDSSITPSLDSNPPIAEITISARKHARALVSVAVQTMSSLKDGEDPLAKIGGAFELITKENPAGHANVTTNPIPVPTSETLAASSDGDGALDNGAGSCASKSAPMVDGNLPALFAENASENTNQSSCMQGKEALFLSELMASCVATLLMVQTLTDRQFAASDVALTLDSALESLRPEGDQNHCIFKDIEQQLGYIKTQILAQIPVQSSVPFPIDSLIIQSNSM